MSKKNLVIVESPTKAKTIAKFLGQDYAVKSSFGHIRDLPQKELGVDVEGDFAPKYVVPKKSQKVVTELKKAAAGAPLIYLATDEDREGEAIGWHLFELLKPPPAKVKRITFHEITKEAIAEALAHPRALDLKMVDAQQARRVLDRLVGYKLSPFLWRKVAKGLSAGRVQSVAVRLIVEREREIQKFVPQEYWTIEGIFESPRGQKTVAAHLTRIDGETLDKFAIKKAEEAQAIIKNLEGAKYAVAAIPRKEVTRTPPPPFTTSTLQQDANRKLNFSAKQTMMLAQRLYEGVELGEDGSVGLITYMRTDSVNLSDRFIKDARSFITDSYGANYAAPQSRKFKTSSKLAQEAHEAIHPTEPRRTPESVKPFLEPRQWKLYDLIWRRAVACQMSASRGEAVAIDIETTSRGKKYTFHATGTTIIFDGFLKLLPESGKETILPPVAMGEELAATSLEDVKHATEPPARYSDASLVKVLEEYGIGRPSTYAPTISTIIDRGYVERIAGRRLQSKDVAFLVTDLLVNHFPQIVDYKFTARLEDDLDAIALGEKEWTPVVRAFYEPFKKNLMQKEKEISKKSLTEEQTTETCPKCGKPLVIKMGRYGRFLACTGFPECKFTKPLPGQEPAASAAPAVEPEPCPKCGTMMEAKEGRFGRYFRCPECKATKSILVTTGVGCPACGEGQIVERHTRSGKIFYSCSRYPDCKFALWQKPTGEKCPTCGSLMVAGAKDKVFCSNKECPARSKKDEVEE